MTPPFKLLSASVLAWHFVNHIVAITVVVRSLPLPPMALVVLSQGRYHRHSSLNDIIHRAFGASRIPSRLEPSGISHSDGKRPDGATLVPWKCGKLLVWDATCVDTYAPSYSRVASQEAGAVADQAEKRKSDKYSNMDPNMYLFAPVVIETLGVFGNRLFHS